MNKYTTTRRTENAFEKTTACVSLLVFFIIRLGTFPYSVEDDASTISQTPTTHYTNTCVKLTIVTHLSFSERIAIANLSSREFSRYVYDSVNFFMSKAIGLVSSVSGQAMAYREAAKVRPAPR